MADKQDVNAGSETSGDQAAETTEQSEGAATESAAETTEQSEGAAQDAGGAAEQASDTDESRTGFADKGLHPGDQCICPDGRKGTVHSFDAGFVCIPNHDQGE